MKFIGSIKLLVLGFLFGLTGLASAGTGTTFANDQLKLYFNATAIGNMADNAATSPFTNIYVALHSADPGAGGSQTTSECAYTSYARVAVARTTGGFTVTSNAVSPVATVSFPAATGSTCTASYFSFGTASSGAGKILFSGTVTPNISISNGVTPQLTTSTTLTITKLLDRLYEQYALQTGKVLTLSQIMRTSLAVN